jgi:hypothetical protein
MLIKIGFNQTAGTQDDGVGRNFFLGMTAAAGTVPMQFSGGAGGEEFDLMALGTAGRTGRAAVDAGGFDSKDEPAIGARIPREN